MNPMKQLTLEKDLQEATVWSQHRPTWLSRSRLLNTRYGFTRTLPIVPSGS